jgi:SAM-dependent methyltransferase
VCDYCGREAAHPVTAPLCDAEGRHLPEAFREETYRLVRCDGCDLVYLPERPNPADLDVFYGDAYLCYESYERRGAIMQGLARAVARLKAREIRRLMPRDRAVLLDYGCGSGTWLAQIRDLAPEWRLLGTDVVDAPLETVRAAGIEAHCCDESSLLAHVERGSVGVVHLFHVIEHVPSPSRTLAALREVLAPGGAILGQTPNVGSTGNRFWGDLWNQWHVPRHFVLFDDRTLARHAEAAGLEVVAIKSSLSGATQWAHSILRWWAQRRGREWRSIREPLYPPLILACLPIAVLESLFARTCHMDFVLRRPA